MSLQEPAFYDLEFYGDAPFWDAAGDGVRRTFLMPLTSPTEFVAFGVLGTSDAVLFVARGRLREHLGAFISRMDRAGASVELYERPPLPWHLVKRYLSDDPYEHQETEGPKNPPEQGIVAYGGGADGDSSRWLASETDVLFDEERLWPEDTTLVREVVVMPLACNHEFLAFGVCRAPAPSTRELFVFAARGHVGNELGNFIGRMGQMGARVKLHDWPSQGFLKQYVKAKGDQLFAPCTIPSHSDAPPVSIAQVLAAQ